MRRLMGARTETMRSLVMPYANAATAPSMVLDTVSVNVLAGCCYQLSITQPAQPRILVP